MATVSELTSKNIANAQANVQTWGNIIINVKVYGAIGDGVTDDAIAFDKAIADGISKGVYILNLGSNKNYYLTGTRNLSGFKVIGHNVTLRGDGTGYVIEATGSISTYTTLDANVSRGDNSVTSNLASSLSEGDLVKIISDVAFSAEEVGRRQGEMHIVESISGTTITFTDTLFDGYTTVNNARIAKVTPTYFDMDWGIIIENIGDTATSFGIHLKYAFKPKVRGYFKNCGYSAINIDDCYAPNTDVTVNDVYYSGSGTSYGVSINNATMYSSTKGQMFWCRHAVAHGGNSDGGVAWESEVNVSVSSGTDQPILDAHPSTGSVSWLNCVINISHIAASGIKIHARYNRIRNLRAKAPAGNTGFALEMYDLADLSVEEIDIDGVTSEGFDACISLSRAVANLKVRNIDSDTTGVLIRSDIGLWDLNNINAQNGGINIFDTPTSLPSTLNVTGLKCIHQNLAGSYYGVYNQSSLVSRIIVNNSSFEKMVSSVRVTNNTDVIELNNCHSYEPYSSHISFGGVAIGELKINGGTYQGNQRSGAYHGAIASGNIGGVITTAIINGVSTSGINLEYVIYGTLSTLIHVANNFHALTALVGSSTPLQVTGGSPNGRRDLAGTGSPESSVIGKVGDTYVNESGGAGTTFYVKESGTGNTGWVAK